MPTPRNITGKQIAIFRQRAGLSQGELATKVQLAGWDISRDVVIGIENSRRQVSDYELTILALVLGVNEGDFFQNRPNDEVILGIAAGVKKTRPGRRPAAQ
jgi:transcriptional regulator with XRE-family HTH domain